MTITRHGKPVAALVPVDVAEAARKAIEPKRARLVDYLQTFPGDEVFERNPAPSRDLAETARTVFSASPGGCLADSW